MLNIFVDYTPFKVVVKYRLHFLCCTKYSYSLFLCILVCTSLSPTLILLMSPSLSHWYPLVRSLYLWVRSRLFLCSGEELPWAILLHKTTKEIRGVWESVALRRVHPVDFFLCVLLLCPRCGCSYGSWQSTVTSPSFLTRGLKKRVQRIWKIRRRL